jgi:hypothetical protein
MKSLDLWLAGFGLRCGALLAGELACFLFVVPTLFNLHSDLADFGAALIALVALAGGALCGVALTREFHTLLGSSDHE